MLEMYLKIQINTNINLVFKYEITHLRSQTAVKLEVIVDYKKFLMFSPMPAFSILRHIRC